MNKRYFVSLLLCLLALPMVSKAQAYVSIEDLNASPPERWQQTYETKWRTVEIDVLPTIQQVDKVPILKVAMDFWLPDVSALGEEWTSILYDHGIFLVNRNDLSKMQSKETVTKRFSTPYDPSQKYGENTDLSLGDALSYLETALKNIGLPTDMWWFDKPYDLFVNSTHNDKTGEPLYPDIYSITLTQKINGIPLLCHVLLGVKDIHQKDIRITPCGVTFCIATPDVFEVYGDKFDVVEMISEDVPLSDFAVVKSALEKEIDAGHIRKIFDIDFGYALYNDPTISFGPGYLETATYYASPVWCVNCYYVESGKKEIRDYTGLDVPERAINEYKTLIINAQTGEVRDLSDNRKGSGDYQGFTSWDDAGGMP